MTLTRRQWEKKLDTIFSVFIRYRDKLMCKRCRKQYDQLEKGIQCSHYWSRRHRGTRWDETNCEALCGGCHIYLGGNPSLHREHKLKRIGQAEFDKLEYRARTHTKFCLSDLSVLYDLYVVKVETLVDRYDLPEFKF